MAARARPAKIAVALLALLMAGCGRPSPEPVADDSLLPAGPAARALHCYLVLTLAIDQLGEFDSPAMRGSFRGRSGTEELLHARARAAAELDDGLLDELRRDPWPSLEEVLAEFDAGGDGQLSTAAEVEEFNRHVAACIRLRRGS
jgi:hypothetical protein